MTCRADLNSEGLVLPTGFSALGQSWALRPLPPDYAPPEGDVPQIVSEILARRGHLAPEKWMSPSLKRDMPEPLLIPNMSHALDRLSRAVKHGERIGIIGDYDVDGATSCAILIRWLRAAGLPDPVFHIPQRLTEGYGPNTMAVDRLKGAGATLLVIADSGTTAFEPIRHARAQGLDVVVLDHHDPQEDGSLPDAIIVNPKLGDGKFSYLCTVGLCFLTLAGLARHLRNDGWFHVRPEPKLMDLLGLAALGTVADMVPLVGVNRAYVTSGLSRMALIPGLGSLISVNSLREPASTHSAGFILGPCINAGGRIGDTTQGTRLLIETDLNEVEQLAQDLATQNLQRREMQKKMVDECIESAASFLGEDTRILVLYNPDWHPGIVGLGAARVKEFFGISAVVIGQDGKGSGRAVQGFHIGRAFMRAVSQGLLLKGGGHSAAGGLTADPSKITVLRSFLEAEAANVPRPVTQVDLVRQIGTLALSDVEAMEMLQPFGMGNPRPRIVVTGGTLSSIRVFRDAHIEGILSASAARMRFVLFNGHGTPLGKALFAAQDRMINLLGSCSINEYRGLRDLQFFPEDVAFHEDGASSQRTRAA